MIGWKLYNSAMDNQKFHCWEVFWLKFWRLTVDESLIWNGLAISGDMIYVKSTLPCAKFARSDK